MTIKKENRRILTNKEIRESVKNYYNRNNKVNLLSPELFFLILEHPVYKMVIIQEPNTLELWNKLHFEEEKTESIYRV